MHEDPRPILLPPARRALNRLAGSVEKSLAGSVLPIALRRVGAAGCRLHPFDLPVFARHIKADIENAGLSERAYLALIASEADEEAAQGLFFDRITAENWTTFPRAQRRVFVADKRRTNPAEGRALIEGVWKTEPAPVRAALLEALSVGLDEEDKPFLDKLATDRADSVKQVAQRLLARVPGTEGLDQRAAEAAQCFKRERASRVMAALGMSGEGKLTLALPDHETGQGVKMHDAQWLDRLFTGLPIAALAKAVGVPPAEIIAAASEAGYPVLRRLLDTAVADGDAETVQTIVRTRLLAADTLTGAVLLPLADAARQPLDPDTAARFLVAPAWRKAVSELAGAASTAARDDGRLIFTATLMPRETIPAFEASLDAASHVAARAARDFAALVRALPA
jgi:Family of unknown function (DUF5691)